VLVRIGNVITTMTLASVMCSTMWGQATPAPAGQAAPAPAGQTGGTAPAAAAPAASGPQWKDRAEYDLFESIRTDQNGQTKLEKLNSWKEKYPDSQFKQQRLLLYLTTYQQLNQAAKMIDTAKQILANDPKDFTALYWIAFLTPSQNDQSAAALDAGEKAANGMLANLDATFSADKKPAGTTDAAWKTARDSMEGIAHKTLGWVAMIRKNGDVAEQEFRKSLTLEPGAGEVSYWLGQVIAAQRKPERQAEALYHFARASSYTGAGALPAAGRTQIDDYLSKAYKGFHGDLVGLPELKTQAQQAALPPAGFKLKSVKDISEEKLAQEKEFMEKNPQLALWVNIKGELTGANGPQYFESSMKDAKLPKLRGKVVQQTPAIRPKELVLAMSDDTTPEATIRITDAALAGKADAGTVIEFAGVPKSYTKDPFMVVFEVEKADISGWPAAAAAPAKRAPVHRAAPRKK
jgi:hypothetical protein